MKFSKVLPLIAIGLAVGLGANKAHAYAYANADLHVQSLTITFVPAGTTDITNFGTCLETSCAGLVTQPASASTAEASLAPPGTGTSTSDLVDAAVAVGTGSVFPGGATPTNNSWALEGPSSSDIYSWGDSQIVSQQTVIGVNADGSPIFGSVIETRQIAEGNSTDATLGTSGALTNSSTEFTSNFNVDASGARVRFDMTAALAMLAEITAPDTGIQATATSTVKFTIRDLDDNLEFEWIVGNGVAFGGSVLGEAFDISTQVSTNTQANVPFSGSGVFAGITNDLAAGQYKLVLNAEVSETVQATVEQIPEPSVIALVGMGLIGVAAARRRKKI